MELMMTAGYWGLFAVCGLVVLVCAWCDGPKFLEGLGLKKQEPPDTGLKVAAALAEERRVADFLARWRRDGWGLLYGPLCLYLRKAGRLAVVELTQDGPLGRGSMRG